MAKWGLNNVGFDYEIVSVIGSQSSGKSKFFLVAINVVARVYYFYYSYQVLSLTTLLEQNLPSWILVNVVEQRTVRCRNFVTMFSSS